MNDEQTSCEWARALILDDLAGSMSDAQRQQLHAHLTACDSCAAYRTETAAVWEGLGQLPGPASSPSESSAAARDRLIQSVRSERAAGTSRSFGGSGGSALSSASGRAWRAALSAAAVILVFAAGFAVGSVREDDPQAETAVESGGNVNEYLLILHENENFEGPPLARAVAEYSEWAGTLARRGQLVASEKLVDGEGLWLSTESNDAVAAQSFSDPRTVQMASDVGHATGFFIIRASDMESARATASTMPHIRYGGTVQLRPIEDLSAAGLR